MILLFDIGNTNTHVGWADAAGVRRQFDLRTAAWFKRGVDAGLRHIGGRRRIDGVALCSVVPRATRAARAALSRVWGIRPLELTHRTAAGIRVDYPRPETIGADRLANAVAVHHRYGGPAVVVDFGTAVTFDVVDRRGCYVGGIIAPGLSAMTDYLHEKTALLPRIRLREVRRPIGRSTEEAMRVGAVHGYRGLVRGLIGELKKELGARRLPVVATGGCAGLIAAGVPEITAVDPELTLEGLRLVWLADEARL